MPLRSSILSMYGRIRSAFAEQGHAGSAIRNPGGRPRASGDHAPMPPLPLELPPPPQPTTGHEAYWLFVEGQSGQRPNQIFQNRSQVHATIVIERLFEASAKWIHLLTKNVNPETYGKPSVINAALRFLLKNPAGTIVFLSEQKFDRSAHPFFMAVDIDPNLRDRVALHFVPSDAMKTYKCNFAVNELHDYRYESNRESHEAIVQFGGLEFGLDLENTFQTLLKTAV